MKLLSVILLALCFAHAGCAGNECATVDRQWREAISSQEITVEGPNVAMEVLLSEEVLERSIVEGLEEAFHARLPVPPEAAFLLELTDVARQKSECEHCWRLSARLTGQAQADGVPMRIDDGRVDLTLRFELHEMTLRARVVEVETLSLGMVGAMRDSWREAFELAIREHLDVSRPQLWDFGDIQGVGWTARIADEGASGLVVQMVRDGIGESTLIDFSPSLKVSDTFLRGRISDALDRRARVIVGSVAIIGDVRTVRLTHFDSSGTCRVNQENLTLRPIDASPGFKLLEVPTFLSAEEASRVARVLMPSRSF